MATTVVTKSSIVLNGAVANGPSTTTGVKYTAPATGFAIVQIFVEQGGTAYELQVNGQRIFNDTMSTDTLFRGIYVAAGGTITVATNTGSANTTSISGAEYVNS